MKTKVIIISLCPLLPWSICAADEVKNTEKQAEITDMQERPFKKAIKVRNEVAQLQQELKRFVSAYEEKKISLKQLRNFYEKRVKSFCLYYHKLSREELAVLLDIPPGFSMNTGFLWDMRVRLNDLTEIFLSEDQGESVPFTGRNYSYTGPKEVVALKVFSDGMDDFLKWMEIFKDRMDGA
ncbi:MAG: hypothetical protein LUE13_02170 [Akkermansiaceae bacterium]|nr:hypothetical protein [Akkermansiaceae bacterium]